MLERRSPEIYNLRRLKPDRLKVFAPTPGAPSARGLNNDGTTEMLRVMRKYGLLPPRRANLRYSDTKRGGYQFDK